MTIFLWSLELELFPNTASRWSNLLYLYSNAYKQVLGYSLSSYLSIYVYIYSNLTACFKTFHIFGNNILNIIYFILEKQHSFVRALIQTCIFISFTDSCNRKTKEKNIGVARSTALLFHQFLSAIHNHIYCKMRVKLVLMCTWNSAILSYNSDSPIITNFKTLIWVMDSNRAFKLKFMESFQ